MFSVFGFALGLVAALAGGSAIVYGVKRVKGNRLWFVVGVGFAAVAFGLWMISSCL